MKLVSFAALVALALAHTAPASAGELAPFPTTLSNNTPLAFGMTAETAAAALGAPLSYVRGRPGDEILVAIRSNGGSGFFPRRDRLYLQFRNGRLAGWKGDWGRNWMWR
jgi:hypothetical protein